MADIKSAVDLLLYLKFVNNERHYLGEDAPVYYKVTIDDIKEIADEVGSSVEKVFFDGQMGSISFDPRSTDEIFLYNQKNFNEREEEVRTHRTMLVQNLEDLKNEISLRNIEHVRNKLSREKLKYGLLISFLTLSVTLVGYFVNKKDNVKLSQEGLDQVRLIVKEELKK